jgi:hypothetical protein
MTFPSVEISGGTNLINAEQVTKVRRLVEDLAPMIASPFEADAC